MCEEIYDWGRLQVEFVFTTAAWPAFLDTNFLGAFPSDECNNTSIFSCELLQCFGVRSTFPVPDIPTPSLCYATLLFLSLAILLGTVQIIHKCSKPFRLLC